MLLQYEFIFLYEYELVLHICKKLHYCRAFFLNVKLFSNAERYYNYFIPKITLSHERVYTLYHYLEAI